MSDRSDIDRTFYSLTSGLGSELLRLTAPPPCPAWCIRAAGHDDFDRSIPDDLPVRFHEAFRGQQVSVAALERHNVDGSVTIEAPELYCETFGFHSVTGSVADMRALAAELPTAIAVAEEVAEAIGGNR